MARRRYPSDHRRWFRVMEDVLDDPKLNGEEWVWGAYLRTLAMLNRTKSRDGSLRVSDRQLGALMGRSRGDVAAKRARSLAHLGLISLAKYADYWLILVSKWPEHQGFAPAELRRDSVETPPPTPTPTPTPRKKNPPTPRPGGTAAKKSTRAARSRAPDDLGEAEAARLAALCAKRFPWLKPDAIYAYRVETLTWWQADGGLKADWVMTIVNRIAAEEKRKNGGTLPDAAAYIEREEERKRFTAEMIEAESTHSREDRPGATIVDLPLLRSNEDADRRF